MATKNPRLSITLEPVSALQLQRLSELTGSSQSKLVGEILEQSKPVFERLIVVLEAAEQAKKSVSEATAQRMKDAQQQVEQQLGLVMGGWDELTGSLLDELEGVKRRSRKRLSGPARDTIGGAESAGKGAPVTGGRAPARTAPTPLSNRGVRSTHKATKKIAQNERPALAPRKSATKKQGG